ncbi:TonB-dependent receptor [Phocaeicola oris]|uniref:TonB-dependent receptor n=1 Tax=Phocaeicola oris TaxID=2896850 RepID=UPI00234F56AE|nr:TonB-dependent receptor [Phocaeicola oris]MCE2616712.1 outer membrane beta-barrel family protein [Phocaeicola oris]
MRHSVKLVKVMILLLVATATIAQAQNLNDTTIALKEVTIKAKTIIHKVDRTLFLPTREARHNAYNPYDLMFNMAIPHVLVDPMTKSLTANGGEVQMRINGIKATQTEVVAILPKNIVRIELIENPGKRYGDENLGAVVDIIVRNREAGGLVNIQATNSPIVPFGENTITAKYNYGHSQWGINYAVNYRDIHHTHVDKTEDFFLESTQIHRQQTGVDDRYNWNDHAVDLSYNYMVPDRYTFNAVLRNYYKQAPHQDDTGIINNNLTTHTALELSNYSPSLDLYFQHILPHQQILTVNLTGTLIKSRRNRHYTEQNIGAHQLADIVTNVEGNKKSIIGEAIYDKQFKTTTLSAGLRHYQMYDRNEYTGSSPVMSSMNQSRTSAFAEIKGHWKKLNYGFSAGATRSWFKESGEDHTYITFTPTVQLSIAPHKNGYLNYRLSTDPQIPSLSALTNVEQAIDTIQISRGNPMLKTYNVYNNTLNYSYNVGKVIAMLTANYTYHHQPIMEELLVEGNHLVIMQKNQRSYQVLNVAPTIILHGLDLFGLKNFATLSLEGGFNRYWSKGQTYNHAYNNFYYNAQFMLQYKSFAFMGQLRKNRDYLLGETVFKGENMTVFMTTWNYKRLQLGAGIVFPFVNNYRTGMNRLSSVAPYQSWRYAKESGNLFLFRLNYHFEFGKAYHTKDKRTHNSDTEDGMLKM